MTACNQGINRPRYPGKKAAGPPQAYIGNYVDTLSISLDRMEKLMPRWVRYIEER